MTLFDNFDVFVNFHKISCCDELTAFDRTSKFSEICSTLLKNTDADKNSFYSIDSKTRTELIENERDLWFLIWALYTDRCNAENKPQTEDTDFSHIKHSELELVKALYEHDDALRETQILIDWLERRVRGKIETIAEKHECLFNQSIAWENTTHLLNFLPTNEVNSRRLPTQLHPDVSVYLNSPQLEEQDRRDNDRFLSYLFLCLRGGDLQRAQRLCKQRGEFWRSVQLDGWRPFHVSCFVESAAPAKDAEEIGEADDDPMQQTMLSSVVTVEGNPNRALFKTVTWNAADNTSLHPAERAIHSCLSGNLDVLVSQLPKSWPDLAWAHCRAMVDARVHAFLQSNLDTGSHAPTLSIHGRPSHRWAAYMPKLPVERQTACDRLAQWTLSDAFTRVESHLGWSTLDQLRRLATRDDVADTSTVNFGQSLLGNFLTTDLLLQDSRNRQSLMLGDSRRRHQSHVTGGNAGQQTTLIYCIFLATQHAVAMRQFDVYLSVIADIIPCLVSLVRGVSQDACIDQNGRLSPPNLSDSNPVDSYEIRHVLRFLAHFVQFLTDVEPDIPTEPCDQILKGYMTVLMLERRPDLLAFYTAALISPDDRVQWYSKFLVDVQRPEEREAGLRAAKSSQLDTRAIVRAVIRRVNQRLPASSLLNLLKPLGGREDSSTYHYATAALSPLMPDPVKRYLLSIDWILYDQGQRGEALVVVNHLLRLLISVSCFHEALFVLSRLPSGTLGQAKVLCDQLDQPDWLVNAIREHECLLSYIDAQQSFSNWSTRIFSKRPKAKSKLNTVGANSLQSESQRLQTERSEKQFEADLEAWHIEVERETEDTAAKYLAILTYPHPGWLVDDDGDIAGESEIAVDDEPSFLDVAQPEKHDIVASNDASWVEDEPSSSSHQPPFTKGPFSSEQRKLQLKVLRELCLTNTLFRLIRLYQSVKAHADCVKLIDLLASEQWQLYKTFSKAKLANFLQRLTTSQEYLASTDCDQLGYPIERREADTSISASRASMARF